MEVVWVKSSSLRAIAYDAGWKHLYIYFKSGRAWRYEGVPEVRFSELRRAESKGSYFSRAIRNQFSGEEIRSEVVRDVFRAPGDDGVVSGGWLTEALSSARIGTTMLL